MEFNFFKDDFCTKIARKEAGRRKYDGKGRRCGQEVREKTECLGKKAGNERRTQHLHPLISSSHQLQTSYL